MRKDKTTKQYISSLILIVCVSIHYIDNAYAGPIDHGIWDQITKKYVSPDGAVNYAKLKEEPLLESYLSTMESVTPDSTWKKNDILAYWINLYNACTIELVVKHYPIESILDIGDIKIFGWPTLNNPFKKPICRTKGRKVSLDHIEFKILLDEYFDERIHFGINCASKSCVKLRNEAYVGKRLDEQLKDQAIDFLANEDKNSFDRSKKTASLSKIFKWRREDFVSKEKGLLEYVKPYLSKDLQKWVGDEGVKVKF